jgi:hypothetical protein
MPKDSKESKDRLLQIVNKAVEKDAKLREELQIVDKFRFIRERLNLLKQSIAETLDTIKVQEVGNSRAAAEDERMVYVYLFNAHGMDLFSWNKMLHPSVYYEHSVNRPLYGEMEHVDAVIRNKTSRIQHGYLAIAVKKTALKESLGSPLLKIKEGSLHPDRLIYFWHNGHQYRVDDDGRLEKIIN